MGRININYIYKVLGLLCMMCLCSSAWAQTEVTYADTALLNKERIGLRERLDFRTNAVDWGLTMPNVAVEYTLPTLYVFKRSKAGDANPKKDSLALITTTRSKRTIGLSLKWNWDTSHEVCPPQVFNVFDARVEWRQYFRTRRRNSFTKNPNARTWLREHVFTTERSNPRDNRAYYWGIYAHGSSYSFKLGKEGRQGTAYGAGLSLGFTTPLYGYKNGYVDFELGGSVGLLYNSYDVYTHDPESNVYAFNPSKSKSGIVPYPVITDLRVAFVYRFMSVSNKFKPYNHRRMVRRSTVKEAKEDAREKIINAKRQEVRDAVAAMRKQGGNNVDSLLTKEQLKIWNQIQQEEKMEAEKARLEEVRKKAAASLGIVITDTLSKKDEKAIRQKMAEMEKAAKEEAKAAKDAEKEAKKAAEKEAELQKDPEKAKKQAEKDAEKAQKEAEKAKKKAEKEAEKAAKKEKKEKKSKKDKDEDKKDKDGEKPADEADGPEKKEEEP